MLTPEQTHLLALCVIDGLNWHLLAREAMRPGGLERLYRGELSEVSQHATKAKEILRSIKGSVPEHLKTAEQRAKQAFDAGARLTTVIDDDYPLNLRAIFNPPPFLFYKGFLMQEEDVRSVAVVGTRNPTPQGRQRARTLARMLAESGVTVLSGLAMGIDTAAHEGALAAKARTVAVTGTGILRMYPKENEALAEEIAAAGAVVSQFWPMAPPSSHSFPRRNITMSGMGQGTVVVEASATSGAKMQARLALEHGKKVFLLKSLVRDYSWARTYLGRGATEVSSSEQIIAKLRAASDVRAKIEDRAQLRFQLT